MRRKLLFFVNPNAGHAEIRSSLMEVLQVFTIGGYDVTVHPTRAPRDLTESIKEMGADYDLIVCTGGDGTLNEAVNGMMALEKRPPLGYIPGGTVNDVASTLGLSRDPVTAAQDIMHGKSFHMDIGQLGKRYFAYVAAFGLFTGVPYETPQEDKRVLGRLAYFFNGVKALGDVHAVHAHCEVNGEELEADILDGLVCSTMSVGGFKAPSGTLGIALDDGQAEVVLIRDIKNLLDFHSVATHLLRYEFQNEKEFIFRRTDRIRFRFDEPVAWTVDGEYGGEYNEVEVRMHQQALEIIVPN